MGSAQQKLIEPRQRRAMWGLVGQIAQAAHLGKDEVEETVLRPAIRRASGQESSSRLSLGQAEAVLAELRKQVGRYAAPAPAANSPTVQIPPDPRPFGTITERQQEVIGALFRQVGWPDRGRQIAFCKRQCKVPWPQTQAHADALMEPLKSMALRAIAPKDAAARVADLVGRPELDAWQKGFIDDLHRQFVEGEAAGRLSKVLSPHKLVKLIEAEIRCGVGR